MMTGGRKTLGIYLLLASCFLLQNVKEINGKTMRMELIHRHSPRMDSRPISRLQRVQENVHGDNLRRQMISHKQRRQLVESPASLEGNGSTKMAMIPGRDYGMAQYFVPLKVGTPAQEFMLIADTGSELTWMRCKNRSDPNVGNYRVLAKGDPRVFNPKLSSTFDEIPCSSDACKIWLREHMNASDFCPTPSTPCAYNYSYLSGGYTVGSFATETTTVPLADGGVNKLPEILIGCSFQSFHFDGADGIIGLGYNAESFAIRATKDVDHKFSYCLVDHTSHKEVFNYIMFGEPKNKSALVSGKFMHTKLDPDSFRPFYAVEVAGISIDGRMLRIPASAWKPSNGSSTILDSGTSLTYLVKPAYDLVMEALTPSLSKYERLDIPMLPMEFCFNSSTYNESEVPRLEFHFADGTIFKPHVKSYVIDISSRKEKCLGFLSIESDVGINIIGNILQQNYFWEFDLAGNTVGFAPSSCV